MTKMIPRIIKIEQRKIIRACSSMGNKPRRENPETTKLMITEKSIISSKERLFEIPLNLTIAYPGKKDTHEKAMIN
jgi:hypothetical protein